MDDLFSAPPPPPSGRPPAQGDLEPEATLEGDFRVLLDR